MATKRTINKTGQAGRGGVQHEQGGATTPTTDATEPTCRNCFHWAVRPGWTTGSCLMAQSRYGRPELGAESSRAMAMDIGAMSAELVTQPEFGCNQFKAKP